MTVHIWKETSVTPVSFSKNVRSVLDTGGPHLIVCGLRTVVADGAATGTANLSFNYELPNGEVQNVQSQFIVFTDTSQSGGGIWYTKVEMAVDEYHPLGDGSLSDPYGVFTLDMVVNPGFNSPGSTKISYEARVEVDDGSPAVVYH